MQLTKLFATALLALAPAMAQYSTPMRDVDNVGRAPVKYNISLSGSVTLAGTGGSAGLGDSTTIVVPAGKRLVIDMITLQSNVPLNSSVMWFDINSFVNSEHNAHRFPLQRQGSMVASFTTSGDVWLAAYQTTIVADPGTTVHVGCTLGNVGQLTPPSDTNMSCSAEIQGHYVTLP